ncbi:hypothetical protein WA577_005122, partial [Blastocystis sp. JDR]
MSATLPTTRKNGLQCPWHPYQILSYIVYLLFIVGGVILLGMPLPLPYAMAFFVVFAVVVAAVGVCAMVTTVVNPADDFKNTHLEKGHYCYVCRRRVSTSTEHCRPCNKCVSGFDHHCKWLNTCIGDKNYKFFVSTLISLTVLAVMLFAMIVVMVVISYTEPSLMEELLSSISFLHLSLVPYRIALFVFLAFDIAVLYYVLDLLIFHIRLTIEGNTTYTHFKKLDAKEKQKREEAKSRQSSHDSIQIRLSQGKETSLSKMLEGSGNAIPAITPSPVSQPPTPKSEGTKSTPSAALKSPHSGSFSPLGDRDDSFTLRRGKESSFSSTWIESDHDYSVTQAQSARDTVDSQTPKKEKSTVWDPSAFKGFAHTSLHMESTDSQFGIVYQTRKNPEAQSVGSSAAGSRVTSPNENGVKSEVLSEV